MTVIGLANELRTEKPPGFLIITRVHSNRKAGITQQTQNICITFVQRRPKVFDVGLTLYKCYTNVLCSLGMGYQERMALTVTVRGSTLVV